MPHTGSWNFWTATNNEKQRTPQQGRTAQKAAPPQPERATIKQLWRYHFMEQRKWFFNHGANFELFNVLFDCDGFLVVQNDETRTISFGTADCFGSLFGFPVNQSCLTKDEAISVLRGWIEIDKGYGFPTSRWKNMISVIQAA
jgi:hypothetical protein